MEDYKYANTPMGQAFQKASAPKQNNTDVYVTSDDEDVVTRRFKTIKVPDGEISGFITFDMNNNKFRIDIERLGVRRSGTPGERHSFGWMKIPRTENQEIDTAALGSAIGKLSRANTLPNLKLTPNEERQFKSAVLTTLYNIDVIRRKGQEGQEEQEDLV